MEIKKTKRDSDFHAICQFFSETLQRIGNA